MSSPLPLSGPAAIRRWDRRLLLGAAAIVASAWLFGAIAEDVLAGDPIVRLDLRVALWFVEHRTPLLTVLMQAVSALHGTVGILLMAGVLALWLHTRGQRAWLLRLLAVVPGGLLLNALVKLAVHRERPDVQHALAVLQSYSFPSGHTAGATLLYGFVAACGVLLPRRRAVLLALLMIPAVAVSRMYLGMHYFSDVLAALFEALAWLSICLTGHHAWHLHRQRTG
jgi:undecaprenyl-diphosphatase